MVSETKIKIALIGPVTPFQSGVALYTTNLHEALQEVADVQTISFKRQYPMWLYPGKTDKVVDPENHLTADVDYSIDVYNPLTWRKTADAIIAKGCDLAILDWWTIFWQPGFSYIAHRLRKHGIKTAFLCHNLYDHDAGGIKRKLSEKMLKQANAYILQSSEQEEMLRGLKPAADFMRRIHPIQLVPPAASTEVTKRGRLELLFFGLIRPYKGLDVLLDAMRELKDQDVYLSVVGEPWMKNDVVQQMLDDAGSSNIESRLEYVSNAEAAKYFSRADAVVLPYKSATGSGVVALAYSYGKPVLATSVGGLNDAVIESKTGWLVPPNSPEKLAEAIKKLDRKQLAAMKPDIEKFCAENSWAAMAKAICEFANKD